MTVSSQWRDGLSLSALVLLLAGFLTFIGLAMAGAIAANNANAQKWASWRQSAKTAEQREVAMYVEREIRNDGASCDTYGDTPPSLSHTSRFSLSYVDRKAEALDHIHAQERSCARALRGQLRVNRGNVGDLAFANALITQAETQ